MNPTKRITDPTFVYVKSHETDIRKLFDRVRLAFEQERQSAKRDDSDELRAVQRIGKQ